MVCIWFHLCGLNCYFAGTWRRTQDKRWQFYNSNTQMWRRDHVTLTCATSVLLSLFGNHGTRKNYCCKVSLCAYHEDPGGSGGISSFVLKLSARWSSQFIPGTQCTSLKTRILGTPHWEPYTPFSPTLISHTFYIFDIYYLPIPSQFLYCKAYHIQYPQYIHNLNMHCNTVSRSTFSVVYYSFP
jgi:hypothetical protein